MNNAKQLQKQHEKVICDELIKIVAPNLVFNRLGNDRGEPDVIYKDGSKTIGIELGTAYYDNSDAKQEWTLARKERNLVGSYEAREAGVLVNPDDLMRSRVQQELDDKCRKKYIGTDGTWLCVEARAPLGDDESFTKCAAELHVPASSFEKTFLFYMSPSVITMNAITQGGYKAITLQQV